MLTINQLEHLNVLYGEKKVIEAFFKIKNRRIRGPVYGGESVTWEVPHKLPRSIG
jgi:hypothetical protein